MAQKRGLTTMLAALAVTALVVLTVGTALGTGILDIQWWTVDGGGTTFSTGGTFSLGGTSGQPDAGRISGGQFGVVGGFWGGAGGSLPTPTGTPTQTPTNSPTNTPSNTSTATPTRTATNTPTGTSTPTNTFTDTPTPLPTQTTGGPSTTPIPTNTPTPTNSVTSTSTSTSTSTNTPLPTSTSTSTNTPLPTQTAGGPSATPVPTNTPSPTSSATGTVTNTPLPANTSTSTNTPLSTQTIGGPSATIMPSGTPTSTLTGTPNVPTNTTTPITTATPAPDATSTASPTICSLQFSDVPPGSTFYSYVRCMACRGIINGYSSGCGSGNPCFRPNNNVTRGQLAKIVSNSAGFSEQPGEQQFQDVTAGSTFYDFIWRLANRGYIGGYACGGPGEPCGPGSLPYFRPNAEASRGQISKIVSNAAGYQEPPGDQIFEDVPAGSTFYHFIQRLASRGVMAGYACGGAGEPCNPPANRPYFRPANNATRGQTSKIVANTFFPNCQTP